MKLAFEIPQAQAEKLRAEAERLGLSPEDLARAAATLRPGRKKTETANSVWTESSRANIEAWQP